MRRLWVPTAWNITGRACRSVSLTDRHTQHHVSILLLLLQLLLLACCQLPGRATPSRGLRLWSSLIIHRHHRLVRQATSHRPTSAGRQCRVSRKFPAADAADRQTDRQSTTVHVGLLLTQHRLLISNRVLYNYIVHASTTLYSKPLKLVVREFFSLSRFYWNKERWTNDKINVSWV